MAKKNKNSENNFSTQRSILNFRPNIHFVEPEQVEEPQHPPREAPLSIDQVKTETAELIDQYKQVEAVANIAQDRVNERSANLVVKLDPVQDSNVLEAVRRHFGDPNKSEITYGDYLNCIADINTEGEKNISTVNPADIENSASDPLRDVFGSLGSLPGLGRPELEPHAQSIKPIDMGNFRSGQLITLLGMLTPGIDQLIIKKIKELVPFV